MQQSSPWRRKVCSTRTEKNSCVKLSAGQQDHSLSCDELDPCTKSCLAVPGLIVSQQLSIVAVDTCQCQVQRLALDKMSPHCTHALQATPLPLHIMLPSTELGWVSSESTDSPKHLLVKTVTCRPCASACSRSGVHIVAVAPCPATMIRGLPACVGWAST